LTSVAVNTPEIERILTGLGFTETNRTESELVFSIPSWRVDVAVEEDLVEEVVRHVGYDKITSELPPSNLAGEYQPAETERRALRRAFNAVGFDEAISFSFIDTNHDSQFELLPALNTQAEGANAPALVTLSNPIIDEARRMRPTLIPGLLESVRHNLNHGNRNVLLFEIGRVFADSGAKELPQEREALALVATGDSVSEGYAAPGGEIDFLSVKGALEAATDATKLAPLIFSQGVVKHLRPGQSARIARADGSALGTLGCLAEPIAASYKFRQPVFVGELDLTSLFESEPRLVQYRALPRYPSVVRDVTLLVNRDVQFASLVHAVNNHQISDYAGVSLVGVYEGKNIPTDNRSVTLRVEYRSDDRTLRDEEVDQRHRQLIDKLIDEFHAEQH
jgi:phenylalanyl-tRNA synthetase beta chain